MPYAIVIHAFPRTDLHLDHTQGKILHGLFYEILKKASAAKGDEIHNADGLKPFSTALLLNQKQRREEQLWPGEMVRIRFTFLDDSLYPLLARYFLSTPDISLEMVRTELVVTRVLATPASGEAWAGYASFEEIYERSSAENKTFCFASRRRRFSSAAAGPRIPT